jgi:hypothetical protein
MASQDSDGNITATEIEMHNDSKTIAPEVFGE